jgi:hypothetical protein
VSAAELAAAAAAFLVGGVVKGAIGLGMPVVVLAVLAPLVGLADALAVFLVPAVALNIWQALAGPALGELLRRLWPFLLAAVLGIALGVQVLAGGNTEALEAVLGGLLILYSGLSLATPQIPAPGARERWMAPLAGGAGGVMFGMTGIFIVPGILFLQALGLRRDRLVQALGITFVTISGTLAAFMGGAGLVSVAQAAVSAGCLLPAAAGILLGRRLRRHISEALFRRLFFLGLMGAGVFMIWRALAL